MQLSKFVKIYKIGDDYAYYHSLRMKPVYLSMHEHEVLQKALKTHQTPALDPEVIKQLSDFIIVVNNEKDDTQTLENVKKHIPKPYISIAYFILTEQCNLACKYCFLGNGAKRDSMQPIFSGKMSKKVAEQAVRYFARQTGYDKEHFSDKKEIIFYGGEPLLNFETLTYVIEICKQSQRKGVLTSNLGFSVVTNGTLLTDEIIRYFIENNVVVSVSIDGADELSNSNRVDKLGKPVFNKLIGRIAAAKSKGLDIGLSITLTETILDNIESLIHFLMFYDIHDVSFNILMKTDGFSIRTDYFKRATAFIIDFYEKTQQSDVYEDRFNRKLSAFINSQVYFSDCAATSGSQIVVTPSGDVGICHGCTGDGNYIIGNINDNQIIQENEEIVRWSQITPINHETCLSCEALGICGGGCPVNAIKGRGGNLYEAIDDTFCVHAKDTLAYLIHKLHDYMIQEVQTS